MTTPMTREKIAELVERLISLAHTVDVVIGAKNSADARTIRQAASALSLLTEERDEAKEGGASQVSLAVRAEDIVAGQSPGAKGDLVATAMSVAKALNAVSADPAQPPGIRNFTGSHAEALAEALGCCLDCPAVGGDMIECCDLIPPPCWVEPTANGRLRDALATYDEAVSKCPIRQSKGASRSPCPRCRAKANEVCILDAVESGNCIEAVRAILAAEEAP